MGRYKEIKYLQHQDKEISTSTPQVVIAAYRMHGPRQSV
jgi:hypothetical protein